jgi:hypothetical protein
LRSFGGCQSLWEDELLQLATSGAAARFCRDSSCCTPQYRGQRPCHSYTGYVVDRRKGGRQLFVGLLGTGAALGSLSRGGCHGLIRLNDPRPRLWVSDQWFPDQPLRAGSWRTHHTTSGPLPWLDPSHRDTIRISRITGSAEGVTSGYGWVGRFDRPSEPATTEHEHSVQS